MARARLEYRELFGKVHGYELSNGVDALLLNEVGGCDHLGCRNFANNVLLDRRWDGTKEVVFADCRELRGAVGFEKVRRDDRRDNPGYGADLADEDGGQEHA